MAQYPERPIRLVLPFPPGGAVDLVTRLVGERMAADLGRPFVYENKAGAGGILATETVVKADPDGYTLLITTPNHTINAALNAKLPYDTREGPGSDNDFCRGAGAVGQSSGGAVRDVRELRRLREENSGN